ncbi:hypothetical protein BGZ63DRAFT_410068 [Mariannaea sp. PMI_226]|nr:hypothetical protein BGZ63DRAFT_410068 [Mariannaea sp. PMI_226]
MLSINFSTPLAGTARSERIKQMTNTHPAFEKARSSQEILVKIQTSLRRMPGVSAKESSEIISQLQEVGQVISQETSQLVDALMNLQLDQEDTDKAIARMSLDANLAKAEADNHIQNLNTIKLELKDEKKKHKIAEAEVSKVMEDLQKLTQEFKKYKEENRLEGDKSSAPEDMIKKLEATIEHLEGQVNNRRSLWVMKHSSPDSVARAIETIAESCEDKDAVHKSIMSLRPEGRSHSESQPPQDKNKNLSHVFSDLALQPARPTTGFQANRTGAFAPPRFGLLTSGPTRPNSVLPDRRPSSVFGPPTTGPSRFGFGPPSGNGNAQAMGPFGRAPSRRGFHSGSYRPNMPELYHQNLNMADKGFRPESALGHRQKFYPTTPSATGRNKYSRFRDPISPEYGGVPSQALTTRNTCPGPLIHLTEMTINAWTEQIMELYATIRTYVDHSANEPDFNSPTDLMKTRLWPVILGTYYPLSEPEALSYLEYHLKDESAKSCLVTRIIIDFIVNRVWVPRAWCGAHPDATRSLEALEMDLERTQGQPSSQRQPLLDRQAAIVDSVLKLDNYGEFSKERIDEIADMLVQMTRPLMNRDAQPAIAYRDLEAVANTAWALSSRILTSRLTFDFRFPEVGSRFSCQSMVPIWPGVDPMELQARHWRIALVTTPVITCRNDTGTNISAHSVTLADVVCMQ